jgi:hypothetical protein
VRIARTLLQEDSHLARADEQDGAGGIRATALSATWDDISLSLFSLFALAQASGNLINRLRCPPSFNRAVQGVLKA